MRAIPDKTDARTIAQHGDMVVSRWFHCSKALAQWCHIHVVHCGGRLWGYLTAECYRSGVGCMSCP